MAIKVLMPALSPTMSEGIINKWLVNIGDTVSAGDILAEIETDKATMEVEAVDEGEITHLIDTTPDKQISSPGLLNVTSNNTPLPAGIDPPVNEKPRTVLELVDIVNPLASELPPDAPVIVAPSKLNWNPPTLLSLFITTDKVPEPGLTLDKLKLKPS